jgi:hypothetical protein
MRALCIIYEFVNLLKESLVQFVDEALKDIELGTKCVSAFRLKGMERTAG